MASAGPSNGAIAPLPSNAQPIVTVDYKDHIPPFATPIRNLYQASMFQVYPHDRGQNYSVTLAEQLVADLAANGVA